MALHSYILSLHNSLAWTLQRIQISFPKWIRNTARTAVSIPTTSVPDPYVFGLPDPDPFDKGTDLNPSIIKKNSKKNLYFYCTVF
jgi:hypothetical protein